MRGLEGRQQPALNFRHCQLPQQLGSESLGHPRRGELHHLGPRFNTLFMAPSPDILLSLGLGSL